MMKKRDTRFFIIHFFFIDSPSGIYFIMDKLFLLLYLFIFLVSSFENSYCSETHEKIFSASTDNNGHCFKQPRQA